MIVDVLDMLVGKTEEIFENEEALNLCLDMMLREIVYETAEELVLDEIIDMQEKSWKTVPPRWKGKEQRERTGLFISYEHGTEIVEQEMYEHRNYAKNGRDALGRFIIEDGSYRMIPKPEIIRNNTFSGPEIPQGVQEQEEVQIEIDEDLYAQRNYAKDGRDAMGRFIIEDGSCRMTPKPKLTPSKIGSVNAWKCSIEQRMTDRQWVKRNPRPRRGLIS